MVPEMVRARLAAGETSQLIVQSGRLQLKDGTANGDLDTPLAAAYATQSNPSAAREAIGVASRSKPGCAAGVVVEAKLDAQEGYLDGALAQMAALLAKEPKNKGAGVLHGELQFIGKNAPESPHAAYEKVSGTS